MADVNGSDHLVKESKLNGYDNDAFRGPERSEDDDDPPSDDDRLRGVVVVDPAPVPNGREPNGRRPNGAAVIVDDDAAEDTDTTTNGLRDSGTRLPLDTRLHHYVPVTDADRRTMNGADATPRVGVGVAIPEDAVLNLTSGRVKVRKGEKESIPLETMVPSGDQKPLGEKAGLDNNGHSKGQPPPDISKKLNGSSKAAEEAGLPANSHRKCLSSDSVSESSSEQKSTGEKLYFTEESRKLCPGWRRVFVCGLILIILAVALLLGVLAATGILLAESDGKNTRYEPGHSLPSIDTVSSAGHSFRPPKGPPKPPPSPAPVTSKVPDSSHSQTIVPNALVGEFTITDENFTEDLRDKTSHGYTSLATHLEAELHRIFRRNGGDVKELKILSFSPGSIKVKLVIKWASDHNTIPAERAEELLKSYLRKKSNLLLAFPVDLNSIHFKDVFDECKVQKGGCSYKCDWDYNSLNKTCLCQDNMVLLADGKSCGEKPSTSTSVLPTTSPQVSTASPLPSTTEPKVIVTSSSETAIQTQEPENITTTPFPTVVVNTVTIVNLLVNFTSTVNSPENVTILSPLTSVSQTESPSSNAPETTSKIEHVTTIDASSPVPTSPDLTKSVTATAIPVVEVSDNGIALENATASESMIENNSTEKPTSITSPLPTISSSNEPNNVTESHTIPALSLDQNLTETSTLLTTTETDTTTGELVTIDKSTIGYHIKNGTIEIYTLSDATEFTTETIPAENINQDALATTVSLENSTVTIPETTTQNTNSKTTAINIFTADIAPGAENETETTTNLPNPKTSSDEKNILGSSSTLAPNVSDLTVQSEPLNTGTALTELPLDNVTTENPLLVFVTENTAPGITTLNSLSEMSTASGDAINVENSTLVDLASLSSIPPVIPQFNRTPEVRAFDNDTESSGNFSTELSTSVPSTDSMVIVESTKVTAIADNSSVIEVNVTVLSESTLPPTTLAEGIFTDIISVPTSSPAILDSGTLSNPLTTPAVLDSGDSSTVNVTELGSEVIPMSSSETTVPALDNSTTNNYTSEISNLFSTVPAFTETIVASENASVDSSDIDINIEKNIETTTLSIGDILDGNTVVTDNSSVSTLVTEIPLINETVTEMANINATLSIAENDTEPFTVAFVNNSSKSSVLTPFPNPVSNISSVDEITTVVNFSTFPEGETTTESNTFSSIDQNFSSVNVTGIFDNNTTSTLAPTTTAFTSSNSENLTFGIMDEATTPATTSLDNETVVATENFDITADSDSNFTTAEITTTVEELGLVTLTNFTDSELNATTEPTVVSDNMTMTDSINETSNTEEFNVTGTSFFNESSTRGMSSTVLPTMNDAFLENGTLPEEYGNFTTTDGYDALNATTVASGVECREDQFLCEPLNKCMNDTFICDGIQDCPGGSDEFDCTETCHKNFMCTNSTSCIMSEARCDGIWDCENGADEDYCTPTGCAQHEVMCLDKSKCIRPGDICDWKYDCRDRSDEVGCVERTTCESNGKFFCNDGLCIPWSLKCDGELDCKDGEDEGNCTCPADEFRCSDGKCLKSSSRCDGHQDCQDAGDEMGCVTVDTEHMVSTFEPYSNTWGLLCADDWTLDDGGHLCQELGFGHVIHVDKVHVSFNGTWMAMRRENLTESSLWTERVSFVESCTSSLAAKVECQKFGCGEYSGLLHRRRRRDLESSSSTQLPFIGFASTFHSNKGCLTEILTPIWLITSAECLLSISKQPFNGTDWYVKTNIGSNIDADQALNHEVLRIILHPHSSKFRSLTVRDYDVALIRLKHALVFVTDRIGAICPPEEQVKSGITCFSGVLGSEKPRAPPHQKLGIRSIALQIVENDYCNKVEHFNSSINQRMLCTQSSEGHTICDNDEGTPLMCLTGINKWFLAGMLTYQRFCDIYAKHPPVFSNLFSMRKFLDQVTGQKQYEVPYDSNIYVIIPPTTPSPTTPEATTIAMSTTPNFTEIALSETDLPTTMDLENTTDTEPGSLYENGTMPTMEELPRAETETTLEPGAFTTPVSVTTDLVDIELDVRLLGAVSPNLTSEKPSEDTTPLLNKTLNDEALQPPNDTLASDVDYSTTLESMYNETQFDNVTAFVAVETTGSFDSGGSTLASAIHNITGIDNGKEVPTELNAVMNKSEILPSINETLMIDEPIITDVDSNFNSTIAQPDSEPKSTAQPVMSEFNGTDEIAEPADTPSPYVFDLGMIGFNKSANISIEEELSRNETSLLNSSETSEVGLSTTSAPIATLDPTALKNEGLLFDQPASNETEFIHVADSPIASEKLGRSEPLISAFEDFSEIQGSTNNKSFADNENVKEFGSTSQPNAHIFNESLVANETLVLSLNDSINTQSGQLISNDSSTTVLPFDSTSIQSFATEQPGGISSDVLSKPDQPYEFLSSDLLKPDEPSGFPIGESLNLNQTSTSSPSESMDLNSSLESMGNSSETLDTSRKFYQPTEATIDGFSELGQPTVPEPSNSWQINKPLVNDSLVTKPLTTVNETVTTILPLNLTSDLMPPVPTNEAGLSLREDKNPKFRFVDDVMTFSENGTMQTATMPTENMDLAAVKEATPTSLLIEDKPDMLSVEMDAVPNKDLSFSVFSASDGMKFESLIQPDDTKNVFVGDTTVGTNSEETMTHFPIIQNHFLTTTNHPLTSLSDNPTEKLMVETSTQTPEFLTHRTSFGINRATDSPTTNADHLSAVEITWAGIPESLRDELNLKMNGATELPTTNGHLPTTASGKTLENLRIGTTTGELSATILSSADTTSFNPSVASSVTYPQIEINTGNPLPDDMMMKTHLISDKLTIEETNSVPNISECGIWETDLASNVVTNQSFFTKWPALGFLQMIEEPKMCAAVALASKFVITSLNCLSIRDSELNPQKWAYVSGLSHAEVPEGGMQNHLVADITPYPFRTASPLMFYEHNVALVRLKDNIKITNFSKIACIPGVSIHQHQECYTTGWTKNISDADQAKQFYSVPISLVSPDVCNSTANYNGMLLDSLVCVNHTGDNIQACQMDLGAPLFCLSDHEQWELQGILSFPGPCDMTQPTVFNSVASLSEWIRAEISTFARLSV